LKDRPDFAEASNNMGIILYRMGSTRQGLERIEAAIRMRPDYPQAHFSRGAALIQEGRQAEAVSEFEEVLRLKPDDPGALRMLELIRTVK
jgi:tetratricopeptide (TPR) repeat protein